MDLALESYAVARRLPAFERFGLANQLRRAACSIPSNIAEGNGRGPGKAYLQFLYVARGSLFEVSTVLELAVRAGYVSNADLAAAREQLDHVGRMLTKIIRRLRREHAAAD